MPTQQDAQNLILAAQFEAAELGNANRLLMIDGQVPRHEDKLNRFRLLIRGLSYLTYNLMDFTSDTFISVFDCLSNVVGLNGSPAINPNYQAPNTTINVINNGSQAINYVYTEANLLDAGGGNYYLPFNLDAKFIPISLEINGVSTAFTFDTTVVPFRIYGFANNLTQSIVLTVIGTTTGITPITNTQFTYTLPFTLI